MNKEEFLKQMILFGQELLAQEQKPKLNVKAAESLQKLYDGLNIAVNAAYDLEIIFEKDNLRSLKARKAGALLIKVQELMSPLAECEDIQINEPFGRT